VYPLLQCRLLRIMLAKYSLIRWECLFLRSTICISMKAAIFGLKYHTIFLLLIQIWGTLLKFIFPIPILKIKYFSSDFIMKQMINLLPLAGWLLNKLLARSFLIYTLNVKILLAGLCLQCKTLLLWE
jgi:hypothetical protein